MTTRPAAQASQPVDVMSLPEEQRKIGAHIAALGIVFPTKVGNQLFLSATFMAEMLSGGKQASAGAKVTGFIIVETSFRVYAYTSSPVQVCHHSHCLFPPASLHCSIFCWCRAERFSVHSCSRPRLPRTACTVQHIYMGSRAPALRIVQNCST